MLRGQTRGEENESGGERRGRGRFREADRKWNESETSVRAERKKKRKIKTNESFLEKRKHNSNRDAE